MKKVLSLVTAFLFMINVALFTSVNAFAASATKDKWSVGWTENYGEFLGWKGESGEFAVDTSTYYKDSRYSLKLTNKTTDNYCNIVKTVEVEPLTTYRFSAMVKYSGYKAAPDAEGNYKGAFLRSFYIDDNNEAQNFIFSVSTKSKKWTKIEYTFTTAADQKNVLLELFNGYVGDLCKGTAWFSDVKLEKAEVTNEWNILTVILKNVDVNVDLHGKTTIVKPTGKGLTNFKDTIDSKGVKEIKSITNRLYDTMETLSGGLMKINDIDYVTVKTPLTEVGNYDYDGDEWGTGAIHGYQLEFSNEMLKKVLDKYLSKKQYHQIIVYAPIRGISGFGGNGGGTYNGVKTCQVAYDYPFSYESDPFPEGTMAHEMLHCIENRSIALFGDKTPRLHSGPDFDYENGTKEWYAAYMQAKLPNGRGIDPYAYFVLNGKYTLVDDDMSSSGLIVQSTNLPLSISKCEIKPIEDKTYSGKKKAPSLTITDGNYTLKKGVDYTVKYSNNKNVGTAKVTVTGKGIYKGTLTTTFNIVPKPQTVKLKKSDGNLKLSWSKVNGASKYIIWQSKDGNNFEVLCETDAETFSKKIKYNKKHTYQYAVTAFIPEINNYSPYAYSNVI